MELVQIDALDAEPAQRRLALAADLAERSDRILHAVVAPNHPALGEDERTIFSAAFRQHPAHDFLGVTEPIDGSGVDPIDTALDGVIHRRNGFVVVLRSPRECPTPAANRPGAESDAGYFHVCGTKLADGQTRQHDYDSWTGGRAVEGRYQCTRQKQCQHGPRSR